LASTSPDTVQKGTPASDHRDQDMNDELRAAKRQRREDVTRRCGVFFGAFNPPHEGHFALAEHAVQSLGLDYVVMVPNVSPPNKSDAAELSHRAAMLALHPSVATPGSALRVTVPPAGAKTDWSGRSEICSQLAASDNNVQPVLLLGQDSLDSAIQRGASGAMKRFPWRIAAFPRAGSSDALAVPPSLRDSVEIVADRSGGDRSGSRSSTQARQLLASGEPVPPSLLSPLITDYCKRCRLYGASLQVPHDKQPAVSSAAPPLPAPPPPPPRPRQVVLLGAPGTGKSTVGEALSEHRRMAHLRPGDWYRTAVQQPAFQTLVEAYRTRNVPEWERRLTLFTRACESRAAELCMAAGCVHFVVERKRLAELDSASLPTGEVVAVLYLTASPAALSARMAGRGRETAVEEQKRLSAWRRNEGRLAADLRRRGAQGLVVHELDTTELSPAQVVERVMQVVDQHGLTMVGAGGGRADSSIAVDPHELVRDVLHGLEGRLK